MRWLARGGATPDAAPSFAVTVVGRERCNRACDMCDSTNFSIYEEPPDANSSYDANQSLFEYVAGALNVYYTPLLVVLGSLGNLISVFVFYSSKLRLQSTSQYLSALALSDTVFLFQLLTPWLSSMEITGVFQTWGFCQLFMYVSYVTCCLSAWLVVAFTVERFMAVLYPLRCKSVCTVTRARYAIGALAAAALLFNVPVLWFAIPTANDCNINFAYLEHAERFNMVDTVVTFTVPLAVIIVLNTCIMIRLWRLERARHRLIKVEQPTRQCSQQRVTRMLLIVSSVFVVLNLPAYILRIIVYALDLRAVENWWAMLQQVALLFFNTNFGINFALYCLSGQSFRRELRQALPCLRRGASPCVVTRRAPAASQVGYTVAPTKISSPGPRSNVEHLKKIHKK